MLPERITPAFCQLLCQSRLSVVVVLHINHPQELNYEVKKVCDALRRQGSHLLNQSVLIERCERFHWSIDSSQSAVVCIWYYALLPASFE